jgi:DNA repair/transcription protein MET18/MMS19
MHALLHTLADVLGAKVKGADPDVAKHVNKLVPHLYGLFIISVLDEQTANVLAPEARLVEIASTIIAFVVQTTPAE